MENIQHCRAMGSLFRQFAVFDPVHSWKYLIEAQKWEHLAEAEIASHFKECNAIESKNSNSARQPNAPGGQSHYCDPGGVDFQGNATMDHYHD